MRSLILLLLVLPFGNASVTYDATNSTVERRQAITSGKIWGTSPIPFSISSQQTEEMRTLIRAAARFWNDNTCVNFQENGQGNDRILFEFSARTCDSPIGKVGGTQAIRLSPWVCNTFTQVVHEMAHSLGVYHEQARRDRDTYLYINEQNILEGREKNLEIAYDSTSFGLPYEFGSVMHYNAYDVAKDKSKYSLIARSPYTEYQESMSGHMPSFLDVLKMNKLYKCDEKCGKATNFCENGGYLDVKTCSKCVCPSGLGGRSCNAKPDGCAYELQATSSTTRKTFSLGTPYSADKGTTFDNCAYIIHAPAGRRVEVTINSVAGYRVNLGCTISGVELKTKRNMMMRGFRYCETPKGQKTFVTETNKLTLLLWTRESDIKADLSYRYI